jgi:hypothetical protein
MQYTENLFLLNNFLTNRVLSMTEVLLFLYELKLKEEDVLHCMYFVRINEFDCEEESS